MNKSPNFRDKFLFILFLVLILTACDPVLSVKGKVTDKAGNGLENVTITFISEGRTPFQKTTDKDGFYTLSLVGAEPNKTRLTFEKEGFQKLEKKLDSESNVVLDVTLEPVSR